MRLPVVVASVFAAGLLAGALGAGVVVHPEWVGLSTAAPEAEAAERKAADADAGRRDEAEARRREDDARRQAEEDAHRRRDEEARRPWGQVSCDHAVPALKGAFASAVDCYHLRRAFSLTLTTARDGAESRWSNARTGVSGTIQVFYTTQEADGAMCRRFRQSVTRDGKETSGVGSACYRNNAWHIAG